MSPEIIYCYYFYYAEENVHGSHPELPTQPLIEY